MTTSHLARRDTLTHRADNIRVFLFVVSLIGLYTQFHLYVGGRIVFPYPLPNLIGMAAFIHYALNYNFLPALTKVILLLLFSLVGVIVAFLNGYSESAIGKHSQLLFSIFAGYGLCTIILQIERERLRRLLVRIAWGILITAFAEVYLGAQNLMTQINSVLYSWRPLGFYTAADRDLALWGVVRPLVFSTEPSLVGIWGSVFMVGATILSASSPWKRYLVLIAYIGVLLFIARSTTAILILVAYMAATVFDKRNSLAKHLMLFLSSLGVVAMLAFTSLLTRVGRYLQDVSFFTRITGPYTTTLETFHFSPLFGLGLGNDRLLEAIVFDVWARAGMLGRAAEYVQAYGLDGMLTNNFFWIWINLGVVGGLFLVVVVIAFVRHLGSFPGTLVVMTTVGTWMTVGGFVDIRSWFFLYFFIACAISFNQGKTNVRTG